jgi:hypothetical protein
MLSVVLKDAAVLLQTILRTETLPKFICSVPPGVKKKVPDIEAQFLGLGFSSVYVRLEHEEGVLADIGVTYSWTQGEPPHEYFTGGRSTKALIAAFAIAVAKLVDSPIEDGSGHWMPQEEFSPEELMVAMTSSALSGSAEGPRLRTSTNQCDHLS